MQFCFFSSSQSQFEEVTRFWTRSEESVLPLSLILSSPPLSNQAPLDSSLFLVYRQKATLPRCVKTHHTFVPLMTFSSEKRVFYEARLLPMLPMFVFSVGLQVVLLCFGSGVSVTHRYCTCITSESGPRLILVNVNH